ncbi:purine/pyrimidine permease [Bacillus cereus]
MTGTFLLLLCLQLSGVFLKGMLGITATVSQIDAFTAIIAFSIFLFVVILSNFGKGFVKSYAVLIGLISGWILFSHCRKSDDSISSNSFCATSANICLGTSKMEYRYGSIKFRYGMYFSFKYSGSYYSD